MWHAADHKPTCIKHQAVHCASLHARIAATDWSWSLHGYVKLAVWLSQVRFMQGEPTTQLRQQIDDATAGGLAAVPEGSGQVQIWEQAFASSQELQMNGSLASLLRSLKVAVLRSPALSAVRSDIGQPQALAAVVQTIISIRPFCRH